MDAAPLPIYTKEGFTKITLPEWLHEDVARFFDANYLRSKPEVSDAIGTYISSEFTATPARFIELDEDIRDEITRSMLPILEHWAQRKLELTALYGIREYRRGATLTMHVDKIETHHVSAIVNVYRHVDTDWPLHIYDHGGTLHKVYMKPGEAILYESARLMHGRPEALDGVSYANFFIHSKEITND